MTLPMRRDARRVFSAVRSLFFAATLLACGGAPEAPKPPAPTATPVASVAVETPEARPTGYPDSVIDLTSTVPRDAVAVASFPSIDGVKSFAPALVDMANGDMGALLASKAGISKALLDRVVNGFEGATVFVLARKDHAKPDVGLVVRFKDAAIGSELLSAVGAKKVDDVHYTGPGESPIAYLEKSHLLFVGTRPPVVDSALATVSGQRPSFVDSPLRIKNNTTGAWLSVDLATLIGEPEFFAEGSRFLAAFAQKNSSIELDEYGNGVPKLGVVLAPTSHDLMAKLPAGAAMAFDIAIQRRPSKTLHDVLVELARVGGQDASSLEGVFGLVGSNVTDVDRMLGNDIAIAVYGGDSKQGTPEQRFKDSGGVVIAIGTRDDRLAQQLVDDAGKHQKSKGKGFTVSPGKISTEINKGMALKLEVQKGVIVMSIGSPKVATNLLASFSSQKTPLGTSPGYVAYKKTAQASSFAALFVDPSKFTALAPEARFPEGTTFGFDASLKPTDKGLELEVKGDAVVAAVGIASSLAIYGVQKYLRETKTAEAKNSLGAMARGAVGAFERETSTSRSGAAAHALCRSAKPVPAAVPKGTKYQPSSDKDKDYQTGDETTGWRCLKFEISSPSYYQYDYRKGGTYKGPARGGPNPGPNGFEVSAEGDLDGDGKTSLFTLTGKIDPKRGFVVLNPDLFVSDEDE